MISTKLLKWSKWKKILLVISTILLIPLLVIWLLLQTIIIALKDALLEFGSALVYDLKTLPLYFYWFIKYQSIEELEIAKREKYKLEEDFNIEEE